VSTLGHLVLEYAVVLKMRCGVVLDVIVSPSVAGLWAWREAGVAGLQVREKELLKDIYGGVTISRPVTSK
jgi:hypothetical protein